MVHNHIPHIYYCLMHWSPPKFSIPYIFLDSEKDRFEKIAIKELLGRKIELVCLAGFMKILSKSFVRNFKGKIINIHPSLLPKYKGLSTFKRVLNAGEKITGCTVHFVDEKLDNGKMIVKKKVSIDKKDDHIKLKKKVQSEEYKAYSIAIRKIYNTNHTATLLGFTKEIPCLT